MVDVGDEAPDFTLPLAGGEAYNDMEPFTLSEAIPDGPIVLAFYPAAFTSGCTEEMCSFRDSMGLFDDLDAQVYGVSVDLPFSQNVWIREEGLNFPMLSDWDHEVIYEYDVVLDGMYGMLEVAERSVFVVDTDGVVAYKWVKDGENPDFDELVVEVAEAVEDAATA
ncbi:redoxin domain-containing protein [Halobellus limi]|jgi:peroxiredoxin|uniref:Peroxiredoxin n=1 Tax=Halobellus limi TaxID=699433 RepID=A0A1H5VT24_9EURY|nr:redoxin domain-containing protein [Halobellus limi]QCC46627.1 peroxiredoxin [Halobellus limi]SEF90384.1 Peroxiredoxin [Halobellus limi]